MADEFEEELERQLAELDETADAASKALEPESDSTPEAKDDDKAPAKESEKDGAETEETDEISKDKPDTSSKEKDDDDTKADEDPITVPIERLSEVSRDKRKLEQLNREKDDKIAELEERYAQSEQRIKSLQDQAEVQGFELHDAASGFSEEDRESLTEEFGAATAEKLIQQQKTLDAALETLNKLQKPESQSTDDPLMDAIVANDDAYKWFLAGGNAWKRVKSVWDDNADRLTSDYKTDAERVQHVVELINGGKPAVLPKESKGPSKSLSDVSGESGSGGDIVDEYLAMGDRAIGKLEQLESSDPVAYERVLSGLRERQKAG